MAIEPDSRRRGRFGRLSMNRSTDAALCAATDWRIHFDRVCSVMAEARPSGELVHVFERPHVPEVFAAGDIEKG